MANFIDKKIGTKKTEVLDYFRNRAEELITEIKQTYADSQFRERASAVNKGLIDIKDNLLLAVEQKAKKEGWLSREESMPFLVEIGKVPQSFLSLHSF
jgi:hypothetical protein